ncbi:MULTISPECIES: CopG family ribbon-helix-helix protein [Candidatus Hamiltonella]|uniref:Addiction module, RHH domain protein n=2 Tax=Candidatus Williamhamiltonella defendens TaxID=138072 RepID=C4K513_HAMD5|nr:CopG family ribbon-helix-helix protein [Candidatus Hamiltonella defensa]ACQ67656.1 addiction module, RHH domain protein [Candidatus Hamiltonella defensa 5AT (Acyrthosiphon pisum)]ATW22355.1 CopG family transcriptional regulator [Candidatus Hamiltonella defensa]ATW34207.1 CopG family transcriptional regulator [Candidatus Hamiltonella defensa]AYB48901.1 ribbon-helix-helix protein, CopG family [Candidatus Hamiltonella defensa]
MHLNERQTITLRLEKNLKERVKYLADDKRSSSHALMLDAIHQYVEREEKQSAYRKNALAAWQEYQETGEHITAEEALNWLDTWGTPNEKSAPTCHK